MYGFQAETYECMVFKLRYMKMSMIFMLRQHMNGNGFHMDGYGFHVEICKWVWRQFMNGYGFHAELYEWISC